jgi:chromosome segregation ATPase
MTDTRTRTPADVAHELGRALDRHADTADGLAYHAAEAARWADGDADDDDLNGKLQDAINAFQEASRDAARLQDALNDAAREVEELAYELDDLRDDRDRASRLAELVLDVERGIRDPSELIDAAHETL